MEDEEAMERYSMLGGMRGWGWSMARVHAGHVQDIYRRRRSKATVGWTGAVRAAWARRRRRVKDERKDGRYE